MATGYVTGAAWIYVGVPSNFAALIPIAERPPADTILRPALGGLPGLPGGAPVTSIPANAPAQVNDFLLLAFRTMTPLFLGTCEDTPSIDWQPAYLPVPVDECGQTYPYDQIYDGQEADIVCTLNFWNEGVAEFISAYASGGLVNRPAPRGIDTDGHIGTLMATEGATLPVWLVFPYAGKAQYGGNRMPFCYRFFACRITHNGLRDLSTRPKKVLLAWRAQRLLAPGVGTFLYDNVLGPNLPAPN